MTRVSPHIRVVALAACASVALSAASASEQSNDRRYSVGVVRADGVLIPFAEFDRGTWRPIWTGVQRVTSVNIPLTLEAIEKRWWGSAGMSLNWSLWQDTGAAAPITVTAPRVVSTPCSSQAALATDFKPTGTLPPSTEAPYPKLGMATTAPIAFEPIERLEPNDVNWARVRRALDKTEFRNAETQRLSQMMWSHPIRAGERDGMPIDLQAVWHVKDSRFFYFEAMRRYPDRKPPRGQPPCELVTYVAGYFWEERSENLRPVGVRALVSYCHMDQATFLWPFGVIREDGKRYWVFQSAGWSGEMYGIVEPIAARGYIEQHVWHNAGRCR